MFLNRKSFDEPTEPVPNVALVHDGIAQRGTSVAIKNLPNPTRDDIEADFAFIKDMLERANLSVEEAPVETAPAEQPAPVRAERPIKSVPTVAKPSFEPAHRRNGGGADKPKFSVQDGPRSLTPSFLQEAEPATDEDAMNVALASEAGSEYERSMPEVLDALSVPSRDVVNASPEVQPAQPPEIKTPDNAVQPEIAGLDAIAPAAPVKPAKKRKGLWGRLMSKLPTSDMADAVAEFGLQDSLK